MIHSATKYLGGHADLLAGAIAGGGRPAAVAALEQRGQAVAIAGPLALFLLLAANPHTPCSTPPAPPPAGRRDLVAAVRDMRIMLGAVLDPHASFLLLRGMKTLELRVLRQNATALELAKRLEAHPQVTAGGWFAALHLRSGIWWCGCGNLRPCCFQGCGCCRYLPSALAH